MNKLLYEQETFKIIGACMTVHRELGSGFLEAVYQEALALEFKEQGIPYTQESKIEIYYKAHTLQQYYIADFICYDKVIVELKAVQALDTAHVSQVLNYLNATDQQLALLVNFGQSSLRYKRLKV